MAGKTLDLDDYITKDQLASRISNLWMEWNSRRSVFLDQKRELRDYIYATDTTTTTNSKLPWTNKTTLPKLTQIRDNLYANYVAALFPKRKWIKWEGDTKQDQTKGKTSAIRDYISWVVSQRQFKEEIKKLVYDYIDYGNAFGTVEWIDESTTSENGKVKPGFVGPRIVRISPIDILMNPVSPTFADTPKLVRVLTSMGEAKEIIERFTSEQTDKDIAEAVFKYCKDLRNTISSFGSAEMISKDHYLAVDGFSGFREYLGSDYVELIFFYGDLYDREADKFYKNHQFVVIDRHKIIYDKPNSYPMAEIPIYHAGWRVRQDNLWAMGPLDNIVGLQYRLDHMENMKSDVLDLTAFPPLKIKGIVQDFVWGPFEKIYMDGDGDVEILSPTINPFQSNLEITQIEQRMEEMAGSPKEAMGFRTPGEKTAFEVQRLENAASRIFQSKISQFEEQIIEPLLNAMLILAQEHLDEVTIRVIDDEFQAANFRSITKQQLSANGRIRAIGARHFAEKAELVQNITNLFGSAVGQNQSVMVHFSGLKLAKLFEEALNLDEYEVVEPFVQIHENAEAQTQMMTQEENVMAAQGSPTGLTPEDYT